VFAIWREEVTRAVAPAGVRSQTNEERWARELDRLRRAASGQAATIQALQAQVLRLRRELGVLRARR
jgi:hypothetical protein